MIWLSSQYPDEALVQLGVCGFQVVELDGFAEQLLVEGQSEAPIDVVAVEDRQAHDPTHEVEIWQVVLKEEVWETSQTTWLLQCARMKQRRISQD